MRSSFCVSSSLIEVMGTQLLVRSQIPPLRLLHAVQLAVNSVDRDQQTSNDVRDLDGWIQEQPEWARGHLISWLFGAFAALALALAAVGLFSVVSYTVVQRTNEFGIRIALGAPRSHVLGLVFNSTIVSVGAGILAGVLLTLALNRVLAGWDAESSRSPLLLLAATGVVLAAWYTLRFYQGAMNGAAAPESTAVEITAVETGVLAPLAVLVVLIGVYPAPLLALLSGSVDGLVKLLGSP